ncbi:hypothetical protein M0804_011068 [Polistes exclamans]|nr:hypothetical protein M0804_011068 [Polistes exclamans]
MLMVVVVVLVVVVVVEYGTRTARAFPHDCWTWINTVYALLNLTVEEKEEKEEEEVAKVVVVVVVVVVGKRWWTENRHTVYDVVYTIVVVEGHTLSMTIRHLLGTSFIRVLGSLREYCGRAHP